MAHYVVLGNFTDQGIRAVKDTAKRAKGFREAANAMGIKLKDIYWTLGHY
ncbi:MAG: GYD domain-containing protein, partial [Candidatus Omnitrophota bacterium]